ncbi:MAG: cation transporter [Flavobacteriales bacterium]
MKKVIFLLGSLIMLAACGEPPKQALPETIITHRDLDSEVNKTVAKMTIGGMMCADGCGGKIQQDLRALPGVVSTELEFEENRAENVVKVEFDPTITDEKKLIECVQSIADGKYPVSSVEVLHYHGLLNKGVTGGDAV